MSAPQESTATLLRLIQEGDLAARERLLGRYLPMLTRWASGRVPRGARREVDTDDLVQVTLIKALEKLNGFESRHEGAFLGYLRTILLNKIRDQARRAGRQPLADELDTDLPGNQPSPLEDILGRDMMALYEQGLASLSEDKRQALILRIEFGYSYEEIAEAVGSPSKDAARMLVTRALVALSKVMHGP